jgi:hypothetical protein
MVWPGALFFAVMLGLVVATAVADGPSLNPHQAVKSVTGGFGPTQVAEGVMGRLLQPEDIPISYAMISVTSLDKPSRPVPDIAILTDAKGRFTWPLRPGSYRLRAVVNGNEIAEAAVSVQSGQVTSVTMRARK